MNIEDFWEYSDPAGSEARFRAALASEHGDRRLELLTQIARTFSLRDRFTEAHAQLDEVERVLNGAAARVRVRYLLERGRTYRSSGDAARATPLFAQAFALGEAADEQGLAADAAHMLAIVTSGDIAAEWTQRGVTLARSSSNAKARALLPALLNNHAWNLHDDGRYEEALAAFRDAETAWHITGKQPQGRIATWSVARCLRSLKRYEEALALQRSLVVKWEQAGAVDGFVFEEVAENLEALGREDEATPWFKRAAEELGKDSQFTRTETARMQKLEKRARR